MKFYLTVAWRNLWRNTRRSIITAMAMAVAIALCMWLICLNSGFYVKFEEILIDQKLGHIQLQNPSYNKSKALQDSIPHASQIRDLLKQSTQTKALSGRLQTTALAGSEKRSSGAIIMGVLPEDEQTITTVQEQIVDGAYLSNTADKEIVIGIDLQDELKLKVGEELFLFTQGADGSMAYELLIIKGIFKSGSTMLDRGAIMHLTELQTMLSMEDQVHEFVVINHNDEKPALIKETQALAQHLKNIGLKVYDYPNVEDFVPNAKVMDSQYGEGTILSKDMSGMTTIKFADKERTFGGKQLYALERIDATMKRSDAEIGVRTWWQTDPTIAEMMGMRDIATGLFLGLVFFISGFGILNTMLMSVFERTREIGILKALGLRPRKIVFLIIVESILLSFVAAIIGCVLGGLLCYLMITQGLDISGGSGEPLAVMGANIDPVVYGYFDPKESILPIIALFIISVLAAIWPSIRAASLKPVEAIRQD